MLESEIKKYDVGMVDKFKVTVGGRLVPTVFSTPQRAFTRIVDSWGQDVVNSTYQIPIMSFYRSDISPNKDRYTYWDRRIVSLDINAHRVAVTGPPQPILLSYQVNAWCYTNAQMTEIKKSIIMHFYNDISYLELDMEEFGLKMFSVVLENISDTSELEPSDTDRSLRMSATMTLRGVLFREVTQVPTVEQINLEVRNILGTTLIDEWLLVKVN